MVYFRKLTAFIDVFLLVMRTYAQLSITDYHGLDQRPRIG